MASALDQIVNIVITQETRSIPTPSFNIPLIMGPNLAQGTGTNLIQEFSSPSDLLGPGTGFSTSSPEYIYAVQLFSNTLVPPSFYVGYRAPATAQVDTFSVNTISSGHTYTMIVNGATGSYTASGGDTAETILSGLLTSLDTYAGFTGIASGVTGATTLVVTANVAGAGYVVGAVDSKLTHVASTPSHGIVDDMTSIMLLPEGVGDKWYAWMVVGNSDVDAEQGAAWTETQTKIFAVASGDASIDSSSTSDLASVLKGHGYTRTFLMYSPTTYANGIEAGLVGGQLPQTPGTSTWKFKQCGSITPDSFTSTSRLRLIGNQGDFTSSKGVNIYETVGSVPITEEGWMCGGQYIDITVGIDWLRANMQNGIFTLLATLPKVPYTNKGIAAVEAVVKQWLKLASDEIGGTGFIDSTSIQVWVEDVNSITTANRAARVLPSNAINFTARLAGAFHFVTISGNVSV